MPRIHFVTFATPSFRPRQWLLECSARKIGRADAIHTWNPARLEKDGFLTRHPALFPGSKGFGWYAWKPYIILQTLAGANDGDLVIYQDVGRREPVLISGPLEFWHRHLEETRQSCIPGVEIPWWGPNRIWTKKQAFESLGLDHPEHWEKPQVQASWSVWRKCPATLAFVGEWAALCTERNLVGGELPSGIGGECPGFREHRWDQSLLTLLTWRDHLQPLGGLARPLAGFNEKSCAAWAERLHGKGRQFPETLWLQFAAHAYIRFESAAKILFKRKEFLPL